jgi:signal transduction histidine kinase
MGADPPRERLTIRAALFIGFGLTFGLWLSAGYYITQRVARVQRDAAAINDRYIRAQEVLSTVRTQVLLGSVFVRDALLDPNPGSAGEYRRKLRDTFESVDRALRQYVPVVNSPDERTRIETLRREIETFQVTMEEVLAGDSDEWPRAAPVLLRTRIMPKREIVLRVSNEAQALNRSAFVQQQTATAELYAVSQRRMWQQFGLVLAASFGIGLFATRHVGRLENRLQRQREKDAENTRSLQRLSSQLLHAQEEERRTIARELHDEVGQVLTAIKVELAIAQRAIEGGSSPADVLASARQITDGALHTVRDLSHLLHPALLDDLGLPAAVAWYLNAFGRRHGLRVELIEAGMDDRLARETEAAAYRIVQEALTNVARHAHASSCVVRLRRASGLLALSIEDDGIGFDPAELDRAASAGHALGLLSIRERVHALKGTVRVDSAPGSGTRVYAELPARTRLLPGEPEDAGNAAAHLHVAEREVLGA